MSFKFPFTNYHELNLTWILDQLKKLFEDSAENVSVIQNYDGRLTAVETELPTVSENASEASRTAAAAASLAQTAKATADTAQENAIQAQRAVGTAQNTAERAQTAANAATQAAQQAQATAQNFDGRITQAENDASQALEASRSFENRVQSAITTANNAARTATDAQGVAQNANQNAAAALDKIGDLSQLDTTAKQNLVVAINEINEALESAGAVDSVNGKTGAVVLDAGDIDYNTTTVEDKLNDLTSDINILNNSVSAIDIGYFKGVLAAELLQPGPALSDGYGNRRLRKTKNKIAIERLGASTTSTKKSVFSGRGTYQQLSNVTLTDLVVGDFIQLPLKFKTSSIALKTIFNPKGMEYGYGYQLIFYACFANIVDNTINVVSTVRTIISAANTDRFINVLELAKMRADATHLALFIASGGSNKYGDLYFYIDSASSSASALALALDN